MKTWLLNIATATYNMPQWKFLNSKENLESRIFMTFQTGTYTEVTMSMQLLLGNIFKHHKLLNMSAYLASSCIAKWKRKFKSAGLQAACNPFNWSSFHLGLEICSAEHAYTYHKYLQKCYVEHFAYNRLLSYKNFLLNLFNLISLKHIKECYQ